MKNPLILPAVIALGVGASLLSGAMTPGSVTRRADGSMHVSTPKGEVMVTPYSSDIFRVTVLPKDTTVTRYFPSQSAVMTPDVSEVVEMVTPDAAILRSKTMQVRVDRATGAVSFLDAGGEEILSEVDGVDNSGKVKSVTLDGTNAGRLYGGGERGHRPTLNGDSLSMYNRQNYGYTKNDPRISQMGISVPYFASDKGFGVLFDDYNKAALELGDTIVYKSDTPRALSYYFINSPERNLAEVVANYSELTGKQPLPPFWSLGYITSKYGYHNQDEALGAIDSLKTRGYPVDGIVLDLYWYGVETDMGRLAWDPNQWPDHKQMLKDLKEKGVNMVLISQPYVNKKGAIDNYNFLSERGMLTRNADGGTHDVTTWVGDAGMLDVSNPDTRDWLWSRYRDLTQDGVAGWWGDLGEPEVHPESIRHANGQTATQFHNAYGNEWSRLIYEGLRQDYPDMRPILLMRGGTAGLQRYGVVPWTTDVSRSWGGFGPQVNLMLSSGMSGLGYMSSDIGGFAVDPAHPVDPELYVRWLEMGAFTPTLRTHAQLKPEPYHYPEMEKISKRYINMRYQWLPYNYTLAYENARYGLPLARPLNFRGENPGQEYADVDDEYMWGDEVLVAPVMEAGVKTRTVLFPKGEWISWWNPSKTYQGGKSYTVPAPLDEMPLFVKAGSFIPQYDRPIENVEQYDPTFLSVRYYPAAEKSEYVMFEDDRKSPTSLESGEFALLKFEGEKKGGVIDIKMTTEGGYKDMPESKMVEFEVIGVASPKSIVWNGTELPRSQSLKAIRQYGYTYDAATRTAHLRFPYPPGVTTITIK